MLLPYYTGLLLDLGLKSTSAFLSKDLLPNGFTPKVRPIGYSISIVIVDPYRLVFLSQFAFNLLPIWECFKWLLLWRWIHLVRYEILFFPIEYHWLNSLSGSSIFSLPSYSYAWYNHSCFSSTDEDRRSIRVTREWLVHSLFIPSEW